MTEVNLKNFIRLFPDIFAKFSLDYLCHPVKIAQEEPRITRQLTQQAIAIFVGGYLSQCSLSLVGNELLIICPNLLVKNDLTANLYFLKEQEVLRGFLDQMGLTTVQTICLMCYLRDGSPIRLIFRVD